MLLHPHSIEICFCLFLCSQLISSSSHSWNTEVIILILSASYLFPTILQYIPSYFCLVDSYQLFSYTFWWLCINSESCLGSDSSLFILIFFVPFVIFSIYLYPLLFVPYFTCTHTVIFDFNFFFIFLLLFIF